MRHKPNPFTVYCVLRFCSALLFSLTFTASMLYHLTVVGLTPLQLVLVGTIIESAVFLFEIPTGVLADVKSRRLSVIVGYAIVGIGFLVEGGLPYFGTVAIAQVIVGLGYTFTSGAAQAWIVDEIGEQHAGAAFLRGSQAGQAGDLIAIPISIALGSLALQLPILISGGLMLLLALFLALTMSEQGFAPTPSQDRTTGAMMLKTVRDARQMARRQPLLLPLLGIGFFYGLYSEGFDRLWTAHLLEGFDLPSWLAALEPILWFGVIRGLLAVVSLITTELVRRRVDTAHSALLGRALMGNGAAIALALAGFGLTRSLWVAVALYWLIGVLRAIHAPLSDTWFNQRIDDPQVRATMFSVWEQVNAVGQITSGPIVGAIGNLSIRAALVVSGLILSPVLPLYRTIIQRSERKDET